jgi:flagellar basal-body rod protein FlgB
MQIETRLSDQLARYLDLAVSQTQGFDFEVEMQKALKADGSNRVTVDSQAVDGLVSRPDGNNVSMDREGLKLAEAQLKFKAGVTLMRLENQRVMDAIHADK